MAPKLLFAPVLRLKPRNQAIGGDWGHQVYSENASGRARGNLPDLVVIID